MITIVDRYLFRETLFSWLAVTLILLLILISNSLIVVLNRAADQGLPQEAVLPLVLFNAIGLLVALVPLGLYLGAMLALGRLYQDSEMVALNACGIGTAEIYRPLLACALIAVAISATLSVFLSPWAVRAEGEIMLDIAARSELAGLAPGVFNESREGDTVVYAARISENRDRLEQVFVHNLGVEGATGVEYAAAAEQRRDANGDAFVVFRDGRRYEGTPGRADYQVIEFREHGVRVPAPRSGDEEVDKRAAKPTTELLGSDDVRDRAELQWRLSSPLFALILVLLAVPLSHTAPRKGRYARLAVAILVYVPYSNLLLTAKNWLKRGNTPEYLGIWWVHAIALSLALVLLLHRYGWRRLARAVS